MPIKSDRQYRSLLQPFVLNTKEKLIDTNYYVEGYATTWQRYVLFEDDEGKIFEQFDKGAFENCDMSDIIMQYDHNGKVLARNSNGTLIVKTDENGLFCCADLSKSQASKDLFEEISNGLITKMSWGFIPQEYHYDEETRTIIHTKVKKIFDVSAVSIPANDTTSIQARSFVNGEIEKVKQELLRAKKEKVKKQIEILMLLEGK